LIVARIIVLDSGPLGDACHRSGHPDVADLRAWLDQANASGAIIAIPEIADYEVRRELLWAGAAESIRRLDILRHELRHRMHYIPITTDAMLRAAELWADARNRGIGTADDQALDADVILAAQALLFTGLTDTLVVATDNARHLFRYVDARHWRHITP
jgi:predicted nucleic acid-binding protein